MKKLIALAGLILATGAGVYLYQSVTTPYRNLPPVRATAAATAAAQVKLDAVRAAVQQARLTGKPAFVSESFTDSELSSLANQELFGHSFPVDNVVVHATAGGMIQSQANAHWGGQTLALFLVATINVVNGNQPQLKIVKAKTGRLDVPKALTNQINKAVEQRLNIGPALNLDEVKVTIGEGLVTITGVTKTG